MNLAEELRRGPKLLANPEARKGAQAREMYRRGYSIKAIAKALGANHKTVSGWISYKERRA